MTYVLSEKAFFLVFTYDMRSVIDMKVTNTYLTKNKSAQIEKQTELHWRCILLLQALKIKEGDAA